MGKCFGWGNVLAPVGTFPPSACHCVLRSCTRSSASSFSMSLRTSAHTGAAIRFPAEIPGKTVVHRANSQLLRICREELLFVLCCRRRNGLPRRFAPRNDMLKTGRCQRLQERITGANSQFLRIRREKLLSVMSYRKEYGLPRRFAPRNDMQ